MPNPMHVQRAKQLLKRSYHQATFMQGQTSDAAKHLFKAIDTALKLIDNVPTEFHGIALDRGTRVRAREARGEVSEGDTGTVTAAWDKAKPLIQWDKDGIQRILHRKRLERIA